MRLDKATPFIGRGTLLAKRGAPAVKRLVAFAFDGPQAFPWDSEPILVDGASVGELTSAGYSRKHDRAVALGYVRNTASVTDEILRSGRVEVDLAGRRTAVAARVA